MPGHKRVDITNEGILPYNIDLTEINGFDNLQNPSGCIKDLQKKAADCFNVNNAFILVNGSTCGILASIFAMTSFGDKVLIARNCHKSVYNACEISMLDVLYALPDTDKNFGIFSSVKAQQIEDMLKQNDNIKLVVITSPTYEGVVSDIKSVAKICHKYGAKLLVDEAHGAHFPFSDKFPDEAVKCGADAAVISLHKTLPSLTQTALLLTNDAVLSEKLAKSITMFQTSSPSYVLMSSIENCIDFTINCQDKFLEYTQNIEDFSLKCKLLKNLKILCCGNDSIKNHNFFGFDISKIIISTKGTGINGKALANLLRSKYKIEVEMAYSDYVTALTSVCDTKKGFDLLFDALYDIDKTLADDKTCNLEQSYNLPIKAFNAYSKCKTKPETIDFSKSAGFVSNEYIWAYPPGIPLVVPGEIIDVELIKQVNLLVSNNIDVYSDSKNIPLSINVTAL